MGDQPTAREIRNWLVRRIAEELELPAEAVSDDAPLESLGLGSLQAVVLSGELEEWLDRRLPGTLVWDHPTIAALARHLAGDKAPTNTPESRRTTGQADGSLAIAVVGIGCRFPGADGPDDYWRLLRDRVDAVREVPADRWNADELYHPEPGTPGRTTSRWGGFLDGVDQFDAAAFGISAREADRMDPQQRLALEVTWEALEHAGIPIDSLAGTRTGVFVGISTGDYARRALADPTAVDLYTGTGNALSIAANRISYALDLQGPSMAVDTACSASLVAVHLACQSLRLGECDLAVAGGVNVLLASELSIAFSQARLLAADGRCKAFDARADGYVRSEGCGIVVLKRRDDARRDGDHVLAEVRGTAVNQDGRSNGLTAPSGTSQQAVISRALADAAVRASDVGYVEAHGTGTALGDPIEVSALRATYLEERGSSAPLLVSAVKTNLGHLEAAAGIAGMIKVVLALQHGEIPANLHLETLNPLLDVEDAPIEFPTRTRSWPGPPERGRLAGVSSFGFGGTNAHAILAAPDDGPEDEIEDAARHPAGRGAWLLPLSARSPGALEELAGRYAGLLAQRDAPSLDLLCAAAARERAHHPIRFGPVAESRQQLVQRLLEFRDGPRSAPTAPAPGRRHGRSGPERRLAFVFPGQGRRWAGMGRQLLASEPTFRQAMERCDEALAPHLGDSIVAAISSGDDAWTRSIDRVQPTLWAFQLSLATLWASWGIQPWAVVGHSMGEVAAACLAESLRWRDAARIVCLRSRLMQRRHGRGAMAAVGLSATVALQEAAAIGGLSLAAVNAPEATVLSGPSDSIDRLLERLEGHGTLCRRLDVSVAAHSEQMEPLREELVHELSGLEVASGSTRFYSTVRGRELEPGSLDAVYWGSNLRQPVDFAGAVLQMLQDGVDTFLEIGLHPQLVVAVENLIAEAGSGHARAFASLRRPPGDGPGEPSERTMLLETLASLYEHGLAIDWSRLYERPRRRLPLPGYPWQHRRHWLGTSSPAPLPPGPGPEPRAVEVRWVPRPEPDGFDRRPATRPGAVWLIVGEDDSLCTGLADALEAYGLRPVQVVTGEGRAGGLTVDPNDPADLARVFAEVERRQGPVAGVVASCELRDEATLPSGEEEILIRVVDLLRAAEARPGDKPELWLLTRGAQSPGGECVDATQSPVWGLGRAIEVEHPRLWGGLIDLDPQASPSEAARICRIVLGSASERYWALRAGSTLAPRLRPARLETDDPPFRVPRDVAVLITGGLGDLGRATARWLADRGAGHLILAGRTPVHSLDPAARALLDELEAREVEVDLMAVDVADSAALVAAVEAFRCARPERPVRGVVHAAGVAEDCPVLDLDRDTLRRGLAAEVSGARNLDRLFRASHDLDFLVLYSSTATVLPSRGLGCYAAANAFLDALAVNRRGAGLPALSVAWGPWGATGLVERQGLRPLLAGLGMGSLEPGSALSLLGTLLAGGTTAPVVGVVAADWRRLGEVHETILGSPLSLLQSDPGEDTLLGDLPERLAASGPRQPTHAAARPAAIDVAELLSRLRSRVGELLFLPAQQVPADRPLTELGMDSLRVMELILDLEQTYGIRVYPREVVQQPGLRALATYLAEQLHGATVPMRTAPTSSPNEPGRIMDFSPLPRPVRRSAGRFPGRLLDPGPTFILSSPRSGSTLLRVMLAGHPALFSPPELNLLPFADMRQRHEALGTSHLDEGLPRAFMELLQIDAGESQTLVNGLVADEVPVHEVYGRLQELAGERLLVDKSPTYAADLETLRRAEALFDRPRYIFLHRHPHAVIESFVRHRLDRLIGAAEGSDPMAVAEEVWATCNANVQDFFREIPRQRTHTITFEELVRRPESTVDALTEFLGIDHDPAVLRPYDPGRMTDGLHESSLPLGDPDFHRHGRIDPGRADAWRHVRLPRQLGPFARRVAAELCYELPTDGPNPTADPPPGSARLDPDDPWSPLVQLREGELEPPLFLVHPAGGAVYPYYELAKAMGPERPVYALQDVSLSGRHEPLPTLDAYATEYLSAIRDIQAEGPYLLGGWSFGGHAAVAIARKLHRQGESVALLAVIDSEAPVDPGSLSARDRLVYLKNSAVEFGRMLRGMLPYARDGLYLLSEINRNRRRRGELRLGSLQYLRWAWTDLLRRRLSGSSELAREMAAVPEFKRLPPPTDSIVDGVRLFHHHVRVAHAAPLEPYPGDLLLLRAEQQIRRRFHGGESLGWDRIVDGEFIVRSIPGDHATLGREPQVSTLAAVLRREIASALVT